MSDARCMTIGMSVASYTLTVLAAIAGTPCTSLIRLHSARTIKISGQWSLESEYRQRAKELIISTYGGKNRY